MGTCADMKITPVLAIILGLIAGVTSTVGYAKL